MKRILPASISLIIGFFSGFQLFAVITLLPYLLNLVDDSNSIDLIVVIAFFVLIFSQLELGKRISTYSASHSIRDSVILQSVAFLIFVLAPQSFWLIIAFIAWLTGFSATQIAMGRWTLLASNFSVRRLEANMIVVGIGAGIAAAKTIPFFGAPIDVLIYVSIALTILVSYLTNKHAKQNPGFFSHSQIWYWSYILRDKNILSLFSVSTCMGIMLGFLVFFRLKIITAVAGIILFTIICKILFNKFSPEKSIQFALYAAGLSLSADVILNNNLFLSAFIFPFLASVIFTGVRLSAYTPRISLSTAERMSFHGLGVYCGMALCGISKLLPGIKFEVFSAGAVLIFVITGYVISFIPEPKRNFETEKPNVTE